MSLQEQLDDDLKTAMKAHDQVVRDTVRLMRSAIKNAEIAAQKELDDSGVAEVLARMAKQYRDSITTYGDAGRTDLVDKEQAELDVLIRYLPEQLGADDITALAKQAADELGATGLSDRGKLMGKLMPELKGKADGALVNKIVSDLLDTLASA
jgi:uncharacterized protein YqeY